MTKKYHFVYITTNTKNNKQYIGDHSTNDLESNKTKKYLGSGVYLHNAIKKHSKKNFKKEILEFFNNKEEAFNAQEKYINKYNTLYPNGYNISPKGGHNVKGCISEVTKRKIGNANRGERNGNYGKKLSEKIKRKIGEANKGERNGFYGKTHTNEIKKKWSKERKGKKRSLEFKKKCSNNTKGEKNPMYGKYGSNNPNFGSKRSEESKNKMRGRIKSKEERMKISESNKNRPKIMCKYCGLKFDPLNYIRWHGDKCKKI
jgi:group I intron endonuclease